MAKKTDESNVTVNAPNIRWIGEGPPPPEVHGLVVEGRAVSVPIPADAAAGFYSEYANFLANEVAGFKRFVVGVPQPSEG